MQNEEKKNLYNVISISSSDNFARFALVAQLDRALASEAKG